jgi:hypothetical protein
MKFGKVGEKGGYHGQLWEIVLRNCGFRDGGGAAEPTGEISRSVTNLPRIRARRQQPKNFPILDTRLKIKGKVPLKLKVALVEDNEISRAA